ncbi:MAG: carboxymuconolactone decarboxylase family protein [Erysipelotrichaceae bacterium]|nr:carboxymuconolactone decarboxylase family protein [Erysipelotrichaceae bacterium]
MREKALELFNELHNETILDNDKDLRNIMIPYIYGDVYHHGTLDLKLRELILIVVNTTNHTLTALDEHIVAGLKAGLTTIEIKEAIYQFTPYIGLGKVQDALELIFEEVPTQATVDEDTRFDKGLETQMSIFGERIKENHKNAPKELKHIQDYLSAYCFGDFYTRNGLELQTRELLTFLMLSTLGGCENQLRSHVAGNLAVGNTRDILIETITQCQPYIGFPRTLNAISIIDEVTKEEK